MIEEFLRIITHISTKIFYSSNELRANKKRKPFCSSAVGDWGESCLEALLGSKMENPFSSTYIVEEEFQSFLSSLHGKRRIRVVP